MYAMTNASPHIHTYTHAHVSTYIYTRNHNQGEPERDQSHNCSHELATYTYIPHAPTHTHVPASEIQGARARSITLLFPPTSPHTYFSHELATQTHISHEPHHTHTHIPAFQKKSARARRITRFFSRPHHTHIARTNPPKTHTLRSRTCHTQTYTLPNSPHIHIVPANLSNTHISGQHPKSREPGQDQSRHQLQHTRHTRTLSPRTRHTHTLRPRTRHTHMHTSITPSAATYSTYTHIVSTNSPHTHIALTNSPHKHPYQHLK